MKSDSRRFVIQVVSLGLLVAIPCATLCMAQDGNKQTREPVYRVSKKNDGRSAAQPRADAHPLDPALNIAYEGLEHMRQNVRDYEATLVKRERIDGKLTPSTYMAVKIRNRRTFADGRSVPFSIYMDFLKPRAVRGREAIWIENYNSNKIIAHDNGAIKGKIRVNLDPDGYWAMKGNRYPIYEAGVENLVEKLIEKGERDRKYGNCEVEFFQNAKINGRKCTMIQVTHPIKQEPFDFHIARIYIDDELQVPVRYAAWSWPKAEGGKPILEEEYTYLNVKLNVGLTDHDFNPDNKNYRYP